MEEQPVITKYTLIGCQKGCDYHQGFEIEFRINTRQDKPWIKYPVIEITPQCERVKECAQFRQEIYNRAENTKNNILDNGGSWKKAHNAWNRIADEYRYHTCSFFQPFITES